MPFAVKSCFDVALWFGDRALNDREYIQPQKLQRLMFLAQAFYSVAYPGKVLMAATFVTDALGPVEPGVFQVLAYGRPPMLEPYPVSDQVAQFLDGIWRRYGGQSADTLTRKVNEHPAVMLAREKGLNEPIALDAMVKYYAEAAKSRGAGSGLAQEVARVVKPRLMRSQGGKAVAVTSWAPKALTKKPE